MRTPPANLKTVALLPMKANSQRVPGKNFKDFAGKPLFRWILDTLVAMKDIDLVVINTDAHALLIKAGLVESDRVYLRQRPAALCGDEVSMNKIIANDLAAVSADTYVMTHTTNPFLSANTMQRALGTYHEAVKKNHGDSLFTADPVQTRFYRQNATPINHDPAHLVQTQDLEMWYGENSNLYIFSQDSFAATKARIGRRPIIMATPKYESLDIDTMEDWHYAKALAEIQKGKG